MRKTPPFSVDQDTFIPTLHCVYRTKNKKRHAICSFYSKEEADTLADRLNNIEGFFFGATMAPILKKL